MHNMSLDIDVLLQHAERGQRVTKTLQQTEYSESLYTGYRLLGVGHCPVCSQSPQLWSRGFKDGS
jgi:hypothetical protein